MTAAVPVLETARLRLRARTADDAEALFPAMSDAVTMRWWWRGPYLSLEELRAEFADSGEARRCWAVTRRGGDRAIGFVSAGKKRAGVSEIGYLFAPKAHGRGYAAEAVGAVIDQLFAEGQRRVFADADPENRNSRALLERLGFTMEGLLRAEWETHIGVRDTALYGLLANERRARKGLSGGNDAD